MKSITCRNCNQPASSFWRFTFSLQGVTLTNLFNGYFRCQHCGSLLHTIRYRWLLFLIPLVVLIDVRRGETSIEEWFGLVLLIVVFHFGVWRFGKAENALELQVH